MNNSQSSLNNSLFDKKINLFKTVSLLLLLVCCAVTVAVAIISRGLESDYLVNSALKNVMYILLLVDVFFSLSAFFFFKRKDHGLVTSKRGKLVEFSSLIPGIAALMFIPNVFSADSTFVLLLSILAIFPILFNKFPFVPKSVRILAGFFQACFLILAIASFYFDLRIEINNPQKSLLQLSALAILLSTLSELRLELKKPFVPFYIFSKSVSAVICLSAGLTVLIVGSPRFTSVYLYFSIFSICYAVYSVVSLLCCDTAEIQISED